MTNKETVERNIGLTFDFLRQALRDSTLIDELPNGSVIEFVEKDFTKREIRTSIKSKKYLIVKSHFELVGKQT